MAEDLVGKKLRGYQIVEKVGEGGYGAVYRAFQPIVKREVAIKVILPQFASHPKFSKRFELEAKVVAQIEHLHIIPLYEYWVDDSSMYIVMRYIRRGSAHDLLKREGPWSLARAQTLLSQIGDALHAAHQAGVVHRDVKPGNILVDDRDNCYLTDFGIAKRLHSEDNITDPRTILGSPAYLSPEQILGEAITPQTDIYGLGMTLYELLTGEHPYSGTDKTRIVIKQLNDPLPPISAKRDDFPTALDAVIQRATAKKSAERYDNLPAFIEAFHKAIEANPS